MLGLTYDLPYMVTLRGTDYQIHAYVTSFATSLPVLPPALNLKSLLSLL